MDTHAEITETNNGSGEASSYRSESADLLVKLSASSRGQAQPAALRSRSSAPNRDWSSALDLIKEAYDAIRAGDERALAAEDERLKTERLHREQLQVLGAQLSAAERRAEAAEARAEDAEAWLAKLHDAIVGGFQKTFPAEESANGSARHAMAG